MSSAKVAIFRLNLLKISRYLLMSCASLGFVPTYQKMRGVTPHFNLISRWYYCYTKQKNSHLYDLASPGIGNKFFHVYQGKI